MGPDVNQMAAQGVAQRMGGGPPGAGGPPQTGGGPPGMGGGMGGGGNPAVTQGEQMFQQLAMLMTSDPEVMAGLLPSLKSFLGVIKQFASRAGGQPAMPGSPPGMGGPPPGGMPPPGGPTPGVGGPPQG